MTPRCLVLLAAYNGIDFIDEQIRSILGQQDVDVEIIISVDHSDDGTENWVDSLASEEPRVRALEHGRKFGGAGANFFRLILEAPLENYDVVALADQDDIWLPSKLRHAYDTLQEGQLDGYSSDVLAFWPDGRELIVKKSQPQVAHDHLFEAAGPGCTYVMSRSLALAVRENIKVNVAEITKVTLHDWYIYAFARENAFQWFIDDQVQMRYRQHGKNQVGVNTGVVAFKSRLSKVFGGWWLNQALLIARLVGQGNDPFVDKWSTLSRGALMRLAFSCANCRRRPRDKLVFAMLCVALAIRKVR